jgi:hypothetical protein
MGFLIARISGSAIAAVLALIAFVLQLLFRKSKPLPASLVRVISGLGAAGALYVFAATVGNVLKYTPGVSSLLTVFLPLLAYALALAVHFIIVFVTANWRTKGDDARKPRSIAFSTLAASIIVSIQLALALFNLIRNWNNFTHGMIEFLYIQLVYLILIIISVVLFWINFAKSNRVKK